MSSGLSLPGSSISAQNFRGPSKLETPLSASPLLHGKPRAYPVLCAGAIDADVAVADLLQPLLPGIQPQQGAYVEAADIGKGSPGRTSFLSPSVARSAMCSAM